MKNQLDCILLIDDDEATNFIHEMVIKESLIAKKVIALESGQEALDYLLKLNQQNEKMPDLIFLDINMPGMNGWEFLEKYRRLDEKKHNSVVMVMLTTSLNPDDAKKSESFESVKNFLHKPLSKAMLNGVIEKHFSEKM